MISYLNTIIIKCWYWVCVLECLLSNDQQ